MLEFRYSWYIFLETNFANKKMHNSLPMLFLDWFFLKAPAGIYIIGKNYMTWVWHYFSIGYFVPRLFSPWHKDLSAYGRGFDFQRFFRILLWNLISRFIGAVLRLIVILVGLIFGIGIIIVTMASLIIWYALPLIIIGLLFLSGITWFL